MSDQCTARLYVDGVEWSCMVGGEHRGHFDSQGRSWSAPSTAHIERQGIAASIMVRSFGYMESPDTETDWGTVGAMLVDLAREIRGALTARSPDEVLRAAGYVLLERYVDEEHGIDWAVILWFCEQCSQHRWSPGPGNDVPYCPNEHPMHPVQVLAP